MCPPERKWHGRGVLHHPTDATGRSLAWIDHAGKHAGKCREALNGAGAWGGWRGEGIPGQGEIREIREQREGVSQGGGMGLAEASTESYAPH